MPAAWNMLRETERILCNLRVSSARPCRQRWGNRPKLIDPSHPCTQVPPPHSCELCQQPQKDPPLGSPLSSHRTWKAERSSSDVTRGGGVGKCADPPGLRRVSPRDAALRAQSLRWQIGARGVSAPASSPRREPGARARRSGRPAQGACQAAERSSSRLGCGQLLGASELSYRIAAEKQR